MRLMPARTFAVTLACCGLLFGGAVAGCSKQMQDDLTEASKYAGEALEKAGTAIAEGAEQAAQDLKELADSKSPARKAFEKDMANTLADLEARLKKLSSQAADKGEAAAKTISDLVTDERKADMLLEELGKASQESYDKAKDAYAEGVKALKDAVDKAEKGL